LRSYKSNKVLHTVYDSIEEVPSNISIINNWRSGNIGDWVLTDDECVIQIIRKGSMVQKKTSAVYVGTCTGTFIVSIKTKMDANRRNNIYSFGGDKTPEQVVASRRNITVNEELFVQYVSSGMQPQDAYIKAFPTNNKQYARMKAINLIKTTRIKTAMKEELKPVLEELGIDETTVLRNINDIALSSEKDETRLKALFKLSDIMDLEDKNTTSVQQITGVQFQGFDDKMIDSAERPKEIDG
tara:strand:- start:670 stop:1392 length:723 start_codon:yes stop_codon:yes gene_type:complete